MNLEGILNISGKSGLFRVISNTKNTVIVESLESGKRGSLHSNNQANMLDEIGIYTYDDTVPLSNIFDSIAKKANGGQAISHKSSNSELITYFRDILKEYDEERVYISSIKKVIQWYNCMQAAGLILLSKETKKETKKEAKKEPKKK